ncbi:MAG: type III-B CRISPR module RAMP protein Cmr1 [Candidatus Poribacteria bacterium]|nr:MAG: type III-B CRISPR module RAMP protein Cmr1 [Candidatus Poribacteria bacterium]
MRRPPEIAPPAVSPDLSRRQKGQQSVPLVREERHYQLITPLCGGGVCPREADPITTVRASEVRGQLRFWWRACRGGRFQGDLSAMREAEGELWGAASTPTKKRPSQVTVRITQVKEGTKDTPYQTRTRPSPDWRDLAYAAFPLAPNPEKEILAAEVRWDVEFSLEIVYPESQREEVEAALWAWETFGGIGARTRRGFGALCRVDQEGRPKGVAPSPEEVEEFLNKALQRHVVEGTWPQGVPHLARGWKSTINGKVVRSGPPTDDAVDRWEELIEKLKNFRQSRRPGRNSNRPGRSHWPEPDEIRRITGRRARIHGYPVSHTSKFPRAQLGLPIIFHFKDEALGDPHNTTLEGQQAGHTRFASPLILRPYLCADEEAVGLAVVLRGSQLPTVILKDAPGNPVVDTTLAPSEAASIPPLDGDPDVLRAFLKTL